MSPRRNRNASNSKRRRKAAKKKAKPGPARERRPIRRESA